MREIGKHLRGHFVAYLALFFALGGTSFAAVNALPKNSVGSPQIKNGSIQKVDISKRTVSALHGLRGLRGLTGATGATGAAGATGATGAQGIQGPAGPFPQGNVPSGTTIRGNYGTGGFANTTTHFYFADIAYGFQMSAPLTAHWVTASAPPACPGDADNPQAAAGQLCIYEAANFNVATRDAFQSRSTRWGASPFLTNGTGTADSSVWSHGTWAATAP